MSTKTQVQWRRAKVLEMSSQGYSQIEIATQLQVDEPPISRDIQFLRQQAQQSLQHHIHEVIPEEYQKCMTGMKQTLKQVIEIGNTVSDPKVKLEAKRIAIDCYRFILDISTNAGIVNDALNFVTRKQEQITILQKIDERINNEEETKAEAAAVTDEQQTTHNGVF